MNVIRLIQERDQADIQETESPKNLIEDEDFISISITVDKQLAEEAQPLIDQIEAYLSKLSGKAKVEHATYILKELQGLQFDPSCDRNHDPVVYERIANHVEQYADSKFATALKTKFGLFTKSENATILKQIFVDSFPRILLRQIQNNDDDIPTSEPISSSPRQQ